MAFMAATTLAFIVGLKLQIVWIHAQLAPALFIFGDSLVDVGNNNHLRLSLAKADFPHNGVDYPGGKATGRFSNGQNAADFLAQKLGLPSTPPPYLSLADKGRPNATSFLNGVNFASGGAGILDETGGSVVQRIPFNKQIEDYAAVYGNLVGQLGSSGATERLSKSLFVVVIGSNDLFGYFKSDSKLSSQNTPQQYIDLLLSTLKGQLQKLYNLGALRIAFVGAGPIGCSPSERSQKSKTGDCIDEENYWALKFNGGVESLLQELSSSDLKGMKYAFCNTYGLVLSYIQNPQGYGNTSAVIYFFTLQQPNSLVAEIDFNCYSGDGVHTGFKDVTEACCGAGKLKASIGCLPVVGYCSNRREYVFWDLYHPTEAVSGMLTDSFFDGSADAVRPINIRQLVAT